MKGYDLYDVSDIWKFEGNTGHLKVKCKTISNHTISGLYILRTVKLIYRTIVWPID